jgi:preprotein translocase subunit SecF
MYQIIKNRNIPFIFSGVLFLLSIIALFTFGLRLGLDFTGGSLLEVSFQNGLRPETSAVRTVIEKTNIIPTTLQQSGDQAISIKLPFISEPEHQKILKGLRDEYQKGDLIVREERLETIGPAFSEQLKTRSLYAIFAVSLGIVLFIAYAFRKVSKSVPSWKYGIAAIAALLHDVVITMGIFALLGHFFGMEVDISFVVALLTILGYSVNDTIVVFDRIREKVLLKGTRDFSETVNLAVNETIGRSINTSMTVQLTLIALYFFGGETTRNFSLTLIIGVFFGTYSSIFVASSLLVAWEEWRKTHK